jgi:hypothetical protein
MDYIREDYSIENYIVDKVENDLKKYPDWIVRLEAGGLGIPSRALRVAGSYAHKLSSLVEYDVELSEEIKKKILVIERIYDRLHGKMKDIIDYRYFQGYSRDQVVDILKISKRKYYNLRNRALESFARGLGYIE